jgi:hypothetical protein
MSNIKELASMFERPAKTEEQKKEDKRHNNVHKLLRSFEEKTSPKSPKENKADGKNLPPPPVFNLTEGYRPASPTNKPQFRLP